MTHSLTTDLEANNVKECLTTTENESNIIPKTCSYDVTIGKSEQFESSSSIFSDKYHQLIQPKQIVEEAVEALVVQKKEETDLKVAESSENHRNLTSLERTAKHFQVQVPSLGFENQHEISQSTTSSTTKIEETIEHMVPKSIQDKYITTTSTGIEKVEISKKEVDYNQNKVDNYQAISQTMSTSTKEIVEISEQEISQTDRITTYDKVEKSVEQAWSENALLINHDLVTMSTPTSEKIDRQVSCKERNTQFDAVVHFPFKPKNKPLLREIAVAEKETSITRDEMDVTDQRYIFDEAIKDEQRNITTNYRTVIREASINKTVSEKDLKLAQKFLQKIQAESIENSNFLADQKTLSDTEVIVETQESESEEYKEQLLRKSEEKMGRIATVEIPRKEITTTSTKEYNKEVTSLNGLFLRTVIQETVEHCTEIIADKLELRVSMDAEPISREDVTQDIILQGPMDHWTIAMIVPEETNIQEYINLQSTTENFVTQQSMLEKSGNNLLEISTSIKDIKTEKADARHPETGHEEEALIADWSKIVRKEWTEKVIPIGRTAAEKLSTVATVEKSVEFSGTIEKMESFGATELTHSLKKVATHEKQLTITSETREHSLLKESFAEACSAVVPNLEVIQAQARIIEYGIAQIVTTGSFARLEHTEGAEKAEAQFAASIKLENYLDTQFAASESISLDIQLEHNRSVKLDEAHSIVQKPIAEVIMNLKAAYEEVDSRMSEFKSQTEDLSCIGQVFLDNRYETVSSRIHEFGSEQQQYMAHWDVLQNATSAEMHVAVAELQTMACTVDAVKQEEVQVVEQIEHPQFLEFTDKTISFKPFASEIGAWKIVQGSTEAVFQQSDEQIAEEAINITDRYSEKQIGVFQEYGSISMETIAHFARIILKKTENYEAEISNSTSRHWEECLNLEASRECTRNFEQYLVKVEPIEIAKRTMREVNRAKVIASLIASSEANVIHAIAFDKQSQHESRKIVLKDINREWVISEQYVAQSEVAKLLDTTWSTVANDFDTAINIHESNRERIMLNTAACQELQLESRNALFMEPSDENASIHFPTITAVSGGERQFKIESEMKESILARKQEALFAESVQKATFRAENLTESIRESSEVQSDAGILLMRHSAKKTSEAASHVIGIVLTLSQHLKTQHAQETSKEASVEFSIPASNLEVEDNIRESIVSRGAVSLKTEYAKAIALQETVELTKSRKVLAEAKGILKGARTDAVRERLKETDSEGFEILSQWTTVDRDLEAEVRLQRARNIVSIFSTIATTEEEVSLSQTWVATECNSAINAIRNIVASECCQRSFQIEFDEVRIWLEQSGEERSCEICWCDKNYDRLHVSLHESVLEKLSAVINLHRISSVLPKQTANECVWRDQQFIAAVPLHIKCEEMETSYTNADICLEQKAAQKYLETVRISANWIATEIFECEQAGDEKFRMLVEFEGKRLVPLGVEVAWPEARKDVGIVVDVEECLEDQAILYAQLTSEQITFAEFNTTVTISQNCEPQMLITRSTKEEIVDAYDEFMIPSEANAITHVVIIGNKGEYLSVWLQETKQDFVTMGFQYSKEGQAYEMEGNFVEKRFGGNYQLITKATKTEDRNTSMEMLRRIENETVNEVLKENVKKIALMEVLASTSKATLIDVNWQKAPQMQTASMQLSCSRKAEPIRSRFLETGETMHTVHAQFKVKESSWKLPIIWKISNYGGHLTLNTESTEETLAYHEIDYHKDEAFEVTIKTLKEMVTVIAPVLSAQHTTEVMQEIRTDLVRPSVVDEAHLFLKQANKGINIEVKLTETADVRQTSYLQFAREVESVELEKIIREARFGGKLNFITCAAEEYELNAVRELTSNITRIAHCSQLIISKNWSRGTYCEATATKSESADAPIILRSVENTDDAYFTVHQKPFMRNALTIQESEALVLIINLNYIKERAKEISEKTIWLKRNAEPCILATFATTEEQKLVQWIVEKRRDTFLNVSTKIKIKNIVRALPLDTIQSESVEIAIYPNLHRIARMLEVCKTLIAPNRGYDMFCKLHETCDENESSNYQFKQENMVELIEAILPESCYGGHLVLNTSAMKESIVDLILRLESKLPTEAETYFSTNISNRSTPIVLSTKSTVSVENNEIITLERTFETDDVAITQKIANIDTVQMTVGEISLETESIILQYQHKEEHGEIQKIIFIAFYGGHLKLETLAASEIIANICEDLISKHLMFAEVCLHQVIANVASPCILSVRSSQLEESSQEYCLQKKRISESETAFVSRTANREFAEFITTESTDEIETITTHWQRDETFEEAQRCMRDKLFGGSVLLSTHFAQESAIMFTAVLTASHSTLERVICAIRTARHSTEHPILETSSTTEMYTKLSCTLNRPSIGHQSTITIQTANQIAPVIAELTESTIISETTNIQYQRPNAVFGEFSEVFPEKRFGGSLILKTLATKETMISIQSSLSPQGPKQLEMQIVVTDKNRATEMCHILASTEKTVVISIQFQKASDLSSVETTKRASRRGEDRCFTLTEPTEINQFNNFSWEHPVETSAGQVIILKEMRYGGRLELSTRHASEQTTTITDTLKRTLAELDSTISRKTANQGESISISCPASKENYISISVELQSKKLAQFEVSVRREAANREEPQKLITNEFSELMLATNISMQKTLDSESTQTMWKAKNQGGIIELRCNASKESYAELYNSLESRLSLKQHLGVTQIKREVRYGEHIAMNLMATEETIFNSEVSFEKQDMESNQSYTIKAINVALPEILETKESLESSIETEKVEVWRRVSAVQVECALKIARECLPVSLQTDSAQETFIRHEAEMRVNVQRTDGTVEIEKSARIMEHEALTCAEAVNVTLRHKSVDEGQEEKVEKRVSFAAEVTEKTMSMDMSVTVEQREIPVIVKKPMKKEQHGRRPTLRQNEAPNFIPVRRNSLLAAMELGDSHNIPHYKTLEDIIKGIKKAGLEYSNLIFGIDYTKSNKYQGERTFDGRNLHNLSSDEMNPYQQVIEIVGKTLSSFDADGVIPTYGFGDEESSDRGIFNLSDRNDINAECNGFEEVLKIYNEKTPLIRMSGPTNFVPLIEQVFILCI
ncbi:unnamed protein product [Onchocerca flexuosa]|uniref:Copine domain-containing protein n=1 Tax=Onchocerca flexuosa TaxID=387005 RepID=A0A183H030_9BILA|nr:unnamed protein product [Onchocerca flexuosa]